MLSAGGACCSMTMITTSTRSLSASLPKCRRRLRPNEREHASSPMPPFIFVAAAAAARAPLPSAREDLLRPQPSRLVGRSVGTSERRKQQRGGGGAIEGARTSSTFRGPTLISTLKVRDVFRTFSLPGKWKTQCALFSNYFDRFKTNIVSFIGKIPFPVRPCNRWAPFRFGQTNGGRFAAEKAMARYR